MADPCATTQGAAAITVILFSGSAILLSILFSWIAGRVQRRVETAAKERAATDEALARITKIEQDANRIGDRRG